MKAGFRSSVLLGFGAYVATILADQRGPRKQSLEQKLGKYRGAAFVDGDLENKKDKLIQDINPAGTSYTLWESPNGKPLYRRREVDARRDIVVFPDPNFTAGDGHYVVLKRLMTRHKPNDIFGTMYQGFYLVLGDGLQAYLTKWKKKDHVRDPADEKRRRESQQEIKDGRKTYNVNYKDIMPGIMVKRIDKRSLRGLQPENKA